MAQAGLGTTLSSRKGPWEEILWEGFPCSQRPTEIDCLFLSLFCPLCVNTWNWDQHEGKIRVWTEAMKLQGSGARTLIIPVLLFLHQSQLPVENIHEVHRDLGAMCCVTGAAGTPITMSTVAVSSLEDSQLKHTRGSTGAVHLWMDV